MLYRGALHTLLCILSTFIYATEHTTGSRTYRAVIHKSYMSLPTQRWLIMSRYYSALLV